MIPLRHYDLCRVVKYAICEPEAQDYLNRQTLRDVSQLSVGGVQDTVWCDDDGLLIDDGILFRLAPDRYRLCCQERHLT